MRIDHRYEVQRQLGVGGMGAVYLCVDQACTDQDSDAALVAVKTITDANAARAFEDEFRLLSRLNHPNLAGVRDFGWDEERSQHYFSVDYIDGEPFDWHGLGLPFSDLIDRTVQLCRALGYVHSNGLLHCDVKPANVLVGKESGAVRLLDFGVAMAQPRGQVVPRGTLAFMAPEWLGGATPDVRSDLYGLGMLLYRATAGRFPFVGESNDDIIRFHFEESPRLSDSLPDVPEWWRALVERLLSKSPEQRHPDVQSLLREIGLRTDQELRLDTNDCWEDRLLGGPWVGRAEALSTIESGIDAALGEHRVQDAPLVMTVTGALGVGKSRLLQEIKRRAQLRGRTALVLDGSDEGLAGRLAHSLRFTVGESHEAWRRYEQTLGDMREAKPGSMDGRRRLQESVGDLVVDAARDHEVVVLLDGGEELDELCRDIVSYAAHSVDFLRGRVDGGEAPRLVFVVALEDGADGPHAKDVVGGGLEQRVRLESLDREELDLLLTGLLGSLPEGLLEEVWPTSRGNPSFALSFVTLLRRSGALYVDGPQLGYDAERAASGVIPQSIEDSLRVVVAELPHELAELLVSVALSAESCSVEVLAAALGRSVETTEGGLRQLEDLGLVSAGSQGGDVLHRPASRALAAVVSADVSAEKRARGHDALLAALEELADRPVEASTRAHHLQEAGRTEEGWQAALEAAREAVARGAFEAARRWLSRAHDMAQGDAGRHRLVSSEQVDLALVEGRYEDASSRIEEVLQDSPDLPSAERSLWMRRLGETRMGLGDHDRGAEAYDEALRKAGDDLLLKAEALAGRARLEFFRGVYDVARQRAEEALALLDGQRPSKAEGLAAVTLGLVEVYQGLLTRAAPLLERAEAVFDVLGDRRELAFSSNARGLAQHRGGDAELAIPFYARSLELARSTGDNRRETIAGMNLSVALQRAGKYREAFDLYLESFERAYRVQDREGLMRVSNNLGNICRFLGRGEEAREWVLRSLALAESLNSVLYRAYNELILGEILLLSGEMDESHSHIWSAEELLRTEERVDAWLEALLDQATWLRRAERHEEARAVTDQVADKAEVERLDDHRARALLEAALAALEQPDTEENRRLSLRRGLEALALVVTQDAPELLWRTHAVVARAFLRNELDADVRHHLARTADARHTLEERIPEDMRSTFFERPDRQEMQAEIEKTAGRIQDAHPSQLLAPPGLLPAGASFLQLLEINRQLNSERRVDRVLNMIMDAIIELTGAERGFIILSEKGRLEVEVARNIDRESIRKSKDKISHSIAEEVIESGKALHTYDAQEDERYRDYVSIHALRLRSIVCYPLKERGESFGAIYLDNRFKAHAFGDPQQVLLEAFVEQAAVAITNARLHEHNERILGELKESRDQVQRLNRELEQKLVDQGALLEETRAALTRRQDQLEARYRYGKIIGSGPAMQGVYDLIDRVKDIDISVIVHGESGTGKELVARAVHFNGVRRKQDFVSINCAAFPETLLESELFGHKRGSFTGADRDKKGLFQVAHRGTLFLDEVGDMSLGMQAKLLRVLQEREVRPVGGHESIKIDVRIIAASNQDLKELIKTGRFREDLYYRLDVVTIRVPPLRERREDISQLVEHFLNLVTTRTGQSRKSISADALRVLVNYGWPGNVRELESTVTTASLFAPGDQIEVGDLANKPELMESEIDTPLKDLGDRSLAELEREAIIQALIRTRGNKMAAAKGLGISRRSLYNKLKQYDIRLTRQTTVQR